MTAKNSARETLSGSRPRVLAGRSLSRRRAARDPESVSLAKFRSTVWNYWKLHGRHDLPWRKTHDPYKILISEVMLQQTQVSRVVGKYKEFLKEFPSVKTLAHAPLRNVLRVWSGLGYNRRGKYLHDAAKAVVDKYGGRVPSDRAALRTLPGVGEYTAGAVHIFAFGLSDTLIETNIRTACIHHFLPHTHKVHDREIVVYAEKAAQWQDPRQWHWALMDYGAHLKRTQGNASRKSAHYAKQSRFEGSLRQVRGAVLRLLHHHPRGVTSRMMKLPFEKGKIKTALAMLARDGMIVRERGKWKFA